MKTMVLLFVSGLALAGCGRSGGNAANTTTANNTVSANAAQGAGANPASSNMAGNAAAPAANASVPAAGAAGAVTPAQFRAVLERDGARKTVQTLDADESSQTLGQVYAGIGDGNDQWLALVPLLSTGTDASTSESLRDAVQEALPRNAAGVLRVLGDRQVSDFLKEDICRGPDQEPGPEVTAYLASAIRAVEAVTDPALQAGKIRCLATLRQAQSPARR